MILELLKKRPGDPATGCYDNGAVKTIVYERYADIKPHLSRVAGAGVDELVIWGGHGTADRICGLSRNELKELCGLFNGIRFRTIVLDACESACLVNELLPLVADNGIVLSHTGIARSQVFENKNRDLSDIRGVWWEDNRRGFEFGVSALFPSVYFKGRGKMRYYAPETPVFETGEEQPFTESDLNENVEKIRNTGIKISKKDSGKFTGNNFYDEYLR